MPDGRTVKTPPPDEAPAEEAASEEIALDKVVAGLAGWSLGASRSSGKKLTVLTRGALQKLDQGRASRKFRRWIDGRFQENRSGSFWEQENEEAPSNSSQLLDFIGDKLNGPERRN